MTEKKWHEDDSFWETFEPTLFGEKVMASTIDEVEKVITLLDMQPGQKVLDMCCGIGRHSLELAKRGYNVTGVDRTAKYIEEAKQSAKQQGLDIEFIQDDARKFCRPDGFDFVLNMFSSFGYFDDTAEDTRVVENIYHSLKKNGKVAIDVKGKESLAHFFQEKDWHEEKGVLLLSKREIINNWSAIQNHWILIKDAKRYEKQFVLRLYSAYELTELLKKCEFRQVNSYSNLDGSSYSLHAKRLITVAQK